MDGTLTLKHSSVRVIKDNKSHEFTSEEQLQTPRFHLFLHRRPLLTIHILQSSQKQGLCPQRITSSVLHHPSWPGGTSTPAPIIQMTDVIDNEAESQAAGSDCLAGGTDFRRGGGVKIYCAADEHRSGFLKHSETFPSHLSKWTKMKWVKRTKQLPESSMSRRKWKKQEEAEQSTFKCADYVLHASCSAYLALIVLRHVLFLDSESWWSPAWRGAVVVERREAALISRHQVVSVCRGPETTERPLSETILGSVCR